MANWIDSKKILTWVKEDNEDLHNWLADRFPSYAEYFKSPGATLDSFIRKEIKRFGNDEYKHKNDMNTLYKDWKNHERALKNITNNVCKLQLEVSQTARDRLKVLSDADGLSQSKYIEKLINYARKNPKLISEDTKVKDQYELKKRAFDDSSEIKAIRENLSTIDVKITRLLDAWDE